MDFTLTDCFLSVVISSVLHLDTLTKLLQIRVYQNWYFAICA